jgi:hypothetical protein
MSNPNEQYDRLYDHCQALARERDALEREILRLNICLESEQWRIRTLTDQIGMYQDGTL